MILKPRVLSFPNKLHWAHRGLVGLWLFNEGSGGQVFDLSGNDNTGTINGAVWVSGKYGSALDFGGAGDYIPINLDVGTTMFVSLWVQVDTIADKEIVFSWSFGNGYGQSLCFFTNRWDFYSSNGGFDIWPVSPAPVIGQWHHVVLGFEATVGAYLYVDGILIGSDTTITTPTTSTIGIGGTTHAGSEELDGRIDNIVIYNRALSASEVALLYREPFCMFDDPA